jgi:hypothetical protein
VQADEPEFTRNKVRVFLNGHTCYELIPESGKVVVLDVGLPIRQAFHALHEQVPSPASCCLSPAAEPWTRNFVGGSSDREL